MCHAQSLCSRDCWRTFAAKSMLLFSSAQTAATDRPGIGVAERRGFTPGEQQRIFIASERLFWMTRNQLRNIERSLRRSAPPCLFGHSARNEGKPRSEEHTS